MVTSGLSVQPQLLPAAVKPQASLEPSPLPIEPQLLPVEPQLLPVEPVPRVDTNPSTVAKDGTFIKLLLYKLLYVVATYLLH